MNLTLSTRNITLKLLEIQDHIKKKPTLESGNLLAVAGWHVVAELLHVSWWPGLCVQCRILNKLPSIIFCTGRWPALYGNFLPM